MIRSFSSIALVLFLTAFVGCRPNGTPGARVADVKGGTDKKADLPSDLASQEKELADLVDQIAAKEKELSQLKAKADALRAAIDKGKNPAGKVYKLGPELFAGMPEGDYPKAGAGFSPERDAANAWFKKHRVGMQVEWKTKITVDDRKEGDHYVLYVGLPLKPSPAAGNVLFHQKFSADEFEIMFAGTGFEYHVDGATVKKVRDTWHDKEVTLRSTITDSACYLLFNVTPQWRIGLSPPTINGYAPPIMKK